MSHQSCIQSCTRIVQAEELTDPCSTVLYFQLAYSQAMPSKQQKVEMYHAVMHAVFPMQHLSLPLPSVHHSMKAHSCAPCQAIFLAHTRAQTHTHTRTHTHMRAHTHTHVRSSHHGLAHACCCCHMVLLHICLPAVTPGAHGAAGADPRGNLWNPAAIKGRGRR